MPFAVYALLFVPIIERLARKLPIDSVAQRQTSKNRENSGEAIGNADGALAKARSCRKV
jgi:hypothetical protein